MVVVVAVVVVFLLCPVGTRSSSVIRVGLSTRSHMFFCSIACWLKGDTSPKEGVT